MSTKQQRLSPVEAQQMVTQWQESGLSIAAFARAQDIAPHRVHYWITKLGKTKTVEPPPFIEVDLESHDETHQEDYVEFAFERIVMRGSSQTVLSMAQDALSREPQI